MKKILFPALILLILVGNQLKAYLPINTIAYTTTTTQLEENDSTKLLEIPKKQLIKTIYSNKQPLTVNWKLLMNIEFKLEYYEAYEIEIETPIFTDAVKAIDGKEVIIKGYVIPIDEGGKIIVLSANPYSSCFFCGNASPASIMSMNLKQKQRFKMDASIKFQGILKLNYDDPEEFYYILEDAIPIK